MANGSDSSLAEILTQRGVSRRDFLKFCTLMAGTLGLPATLTPKIVHALETAHRLQLPLLRAGFPQYDQLGGYQRTWIGYRGTRQTLFELANMMLELEKGEIEPYRSVYAQKPEYHEANDGAATTLESSAIRH